jgi:hypothetical protein
MQLRIASGKTRELSAVRVPDRQAGKVVERITRSTEDAR